MGHNGRVSLYRDEGVVLRTQKLGEADRIITLLTREHGRVRAVAKGVRRTKSKFGARLEPFMPRRRAAATPAARCDIVTQAETIAPYGAGDRHRLRPLHRRHGHAGDRRAVHRPGGRAGRAAVPAARRRRCARWPAASTSRASCSTRSCCAPSPSPATRRASTTARAAARPGRTGSSPSPPAAWSAATAGRPARAVPAPRDAALLGALLDRRLGRRGRQRGRHRREGSGLVAAYLQWHLERGPAVAAAAWSG